VAEVLDDRGDHVEHAAGVPVGGVDHEEVDAGLDELPGARVLVLADADGAADAEATAVVLRRVRELLALGEVLDGDEAAQVAVGVDDRATRSCAA
jgi:hypothetical protein